MAWLSHWGGFDVALGGLAPGGLVPGTGFLRPLCPQSRYFSRIAWPLGRCRPPTLSAMGQNRQKLGNNCLLTPSARCGRVGP